MTKEQEMTPEQKQKMKDFFAMLAAHGVTEAICLNPPKSGVGPVKIEQSGELSMIDGQDGQRKNIDIK